MDFQPSTVIMCNILINQKGALVSFICRFSCSNLNVFDVRLNIKIVNV